MGIHGYPYHPLGLPIFIQQHTQYILTKRGSEEGKVHAVRITTFEVR